MPMAGSTVSEGGSPVGLEQQPPMILRFKAEAAAATEVFAGRCHVPNAPNITVRRSLQFVDTSLSDFASSCPHQIYSSRLSHARLPGRHPASNGTCEAL